MAAESPKRTMKYSHTIIRPHAFSDKSVMESVVDFISDVVPQAYCGNQKVEDKEKIQWVKFENTDGNDLANNPDFNSTESKGIPLLLILGYSNGVQIWNIMPNGEAQEALSLRQGPIKILRVLPTPTPVFTEYDPYSVKRPLAAICDTSSAGQPYCSVKFVSLRTGDEVHNVSFKTLTVHGIECNKRVMVVVFQEKLCVFDSCSLTQLFWVTSCFPSTGPNYNPVALGTRWLAYADKRLIPLHQSCGGMSGDGAQSYAATVISAAKGAFKGLTMFGEAIVSNVTGTNYKPAPTTKKVENVVDNGHRPGIVSIIDVQGVSGDHFSVTEENECEGLIAHFHAHANEPVAAMNFDVTGTLLLTACKLGHNFHVFRIMAHPCSSSLGAVHHLYTLHRGDTTAKVIDMSFSQDSRWVTVNTHRGTTHVFPITPYGGTVNLRTHCSPRVVNRASRYHKSAGLDETDYTTSARRSPVLSGSPGSSTGQYDNYPSLMRHNAINNSMGNPRLPPFPHPTTVYPLAQIKQPLNLVTTIGGTKTQSPTHSSTGTDNIIAVSSCFCTPRLWVGGSPNLSVDKREERRAVDSLFVVNHIGTLVEYILEPKPKAAASEKISDESMLDLAVTGYTQWHLQRSKTSEEVKPPLASNNPLMLAADAVRTQQPTSFQDLGELAPVTRHDSKDSLSSEHSNKDTDIDEQWLSQVEIFTHVGPHRRLWMGPQFAFKTYQNVQNTTVLSPNSSALLSQSPEANVAAMDIVTDECDLESLKIQPTRSSPVAMPNSRPAYRRQAMGSDSTPPPGKGPNTPLLIEAGSFDQSPNLCDVYSSWAESTVAKQPRGSEEEEDRIKETLAEAMLESPLKEGGPSCIRNGSKVNSERELLGKLKNEKGRKKSGKKLSDLSSVKELCPSEVPEGSKRKNESVNRLELEKSKSSSLKQNETGDIPRFKPEQEENMLCPKVESDKASNSTSKKSKKSKKGKDACKTNTEKVTDEGLKVSTDKNVEKGKLQESKDDKDVKTLSEKTEGKDVQVKSESMKESMVGLENAKENKVKLAQDKVKTSKVKSDSECMEEDRLKTVSVETTKNLVKMVDNCTEIVKMIDKGTEMDLKLDVETTDKMIQNKKAEKVQVRSDVVDVGEMFGGNSKGKSVLSKKVEQHTAETSHDFEFQKKDKGERVEKTEQEKKELSTGTINNESTDESKAKSQSGKERKKKNKKSDVVSLYVKEQTEDIAISDYNTNESAYSGFPKEISDDKNTDEVDYNLKSDVDMIDPKTVTLDRGDDVKNVACGNIDLTQTDVSKKEDENLGWDSVENMLGKKRSKSKNKKASSPVPQVTTREKNLDSKNNIECMSEKGYQKPVDSSNIEKKDEGLEHTPKETTGKKTKSNGKKEMSPVSQVTTGKKNVDSKDDIERMSEKEKQKSADLSSSGKTDKDLGSASEETTKIKKVYDKKESSPVPKANTEDKTLHSKNNIEFMLEKEKQKSAASLSSEKTDEGLEPASLDTTGKRMKSNNKKENSPVPPVKSKEKKVLNSNTENLPNQETQKPAKSADIDKKEDESLGWASVENMGKRSKSRNKKAVSPVSQTPNLEGKNLKSNKEQVVEQGEGKKNEAKIDKAKKISCDSSSEISYEMKITESKMSEKDQESATNTEITSKEVGVIQSEKIKSEVKSRNNDSISKSNFTKEQHCLEVISKEYKQSNSLNLKQDDEVKTDVISSCDQAKSKTDNLNLRSVEPTKCVETDISESDGQKEDNGIVNQVKKSGKKGKKSAANATEIKPKNNDVDQNQTKDIPENVIKNLLDTQPETSLSIERSEKPVTVTNDKYQDKKFFDVGENTETVESIKHVGVKNDILKDDDICRKKDEKRKEMLSEASETRLKSPAESEIKLKPAKKWAWGNVAAWDSVSKSHVDQTTESKSENEEFPSLCGDGILNKCVKNEQEFPNLLGGVRIQKKDLKDEDEFPSLERGGAKEEKTSSVGKSFWSKMKSGDNVNDKVSPKKDKAKDMADIVKTETSCEMNIGIKTSEDNVSKTITGDNVEKKWGSGNIHERRDNINNDTESKTTMAKKKPTNDVVEAKALVKEVEVMRPKDVEKKEFSLEINNTKTNNKFTTSSSSLTSETVGNKKDESSSAANGNNSAKKKTKGQKKKDNTTGKCQENINTGSREGSPVSDACDVKDEVKNESESNVKIEKINKNLTAAIELDISEEYNKDSFKTDCSNGKSVEKPCDVSSSPKTEKHTNDKKTDIDEGDDSERSHVNSENILEREVKVKEVCSSISSNRKKLENIDSKLSSEEEEEYLDAKGSSSDSDLASEVDKSSVKESVSDKVLISKDGNSSDSKKAGDVDTVEVNPETACSGTQKRESTPESQNVKSNGSGKRNGKNKKKNKKGW